ncbi:hypothetical protein Gotri_006893 [Gossypium trilobum]|uniref:Uncharacterized protein n=1 Tax=Gossypium trilobum TaxID=34281 RepID=A0A7J9FGI4_9ROSI|nr:hypothetical protein [Gossypium trilobum]
MGLAIIPGKVDLCKALLGKVLDKFEGGRISINWLEDNFDELLSIHHELEICCLIHIIPRDASGHGTEYDIDWRLSALAAVLDLVVTTVSTWNHGLSYMGLPDELEDFRLLLDQRTEAEFEWISYTDIDIISCILSGVLANREMWDAKMSLVVHDGRCRVPTVAQTRRQVVSAVIGGEDKENLAHEAGNVVDVRGLSNEERLLWCSKGYAPFGATTVVVIK